MIFLSHLCGGEYVIWGAIFALSFLSHLCGGESIIVQFHHVVPV
ncbi:hypothetical protein BAZOLSSOX_2061 [uncultured Gammaproteobacteria bacterium]|nr:hypothetical protein [uncultured Gammaproteobacteria bacterium]VVH58047.1 hypothetical protein BAZOLSSOX_2061 [uncultured Gammaproteobacteria bacterium]